MAVDPELVRFDCGRSEVEAAFARMNAMLGLGEAGTASQCAVTPVELHQVSDTCTKNDTNTVKKDSVYSSSNPYEYMPQPDPRLRAAAKCRITKQELSFFFPEAGDPAEEAKEFCKGCPVQRDCLEYALENRIMYGIWGGTGERERKRIRTARNAINRAAKKSAA